MPSELPPRRRQSSSQVSTVAEFRLETQAWSGEGQPTPERLVFRPWAGAPRDKPVTLFTSTWDPEKRSMPWIDHLRQRFLQGEPTRPVRADEKLWLLAPDPTATLFIIDSFDDYRSLTDQYEYRWNRLRGPDWRRIATDLPFDGVHYTGNARQPAEWSPNDPVPLVSWDVESTAWFTFYLNVLRCVGKIANGWTLDFEPPQ